MKESMTKKTILVVSIILIAGFITSQAIAHMGGGYNMMYGNQMGYGGRMMGNGSYMMGYGNHMGSEFSVEDQEKMHEQMDAFFESTKEIREKIYEKRVALNKEYAKTQKDQEAINTLEKDLFDLNAQFEKQRFDHMKKIQNLFSDKDGRYFMGMGPGYGPGCF